MVNGIALEFDTISLWRLAGIDNYEAAEFNAKKGDKNLTLHYLNLAVDSYYSWENQWLLRYQILGGSEWGQGDFGENISRLTDRETIIEQWNCQNLDTLFRMS